MQAMDDWLDSLKQILAPGLTPRGSFPSFFWGAVPRIVIRGTMIGQDDSVIAEREKVR